MCPAALPNPAQHPVTGGLFLSPVPAGSGWPGDPATTETPVAATPAQVRRLARGADGIRELDARVSVCRACPRLVAWRGAGAPQGGPGSLPPPPDWGRPGAAFRGPDGGGLILGV